MPDLIIVVPCHNEARRLDVGGFERFVRTEPEIDFLFVNDGSQDATGKLLDELVHRNPGRFQVLTLLHNSGKAEAVRLGLLQVLASSSLYVGYWDADLATPLAAIGRFRAVLEERPAIEAVIGSRGQLLGRAINRKPIRHYLGRLFATAASLVLNLPVYDTQCGAKLFRVTDHLRRALEQPFRSRWIFDVEFLARLMNSWGGPAAAREALYELPLDEWRDVSGSKLRPVDMLRVPWELASIYWRYSRRRNRSRAIPSLAHRAGVTDSSLALRAGVTSPPATSRPATSFQSHSGVTLIELLVVISIIGILMAILLPAVQMAREAGRRMQCSSQLRQLGLAVHNHHDVYGVLPINVSPFPDGPNPAPRRSGRGWIVGALPYLEQPALSDEINAAAAGDFFAGGGLKTPACLPLVQTRLKVLICPSAAADPISTTCFQWEGIPTAVTTYKGVIGDNRMGGSLSQFPGSEPDCHFRLGCNGLFWRVTYQQPLRLADVLDGTSNTFMIGEDVPAHNDHSAAFYANGDYASCHAPLNYFPRPPDPKDWPNVMSFRSRHPGGAQFCLADGSARFISQTIDRPLYRALSTRAGGESAAVP